MALDPSALAKLQGLLGENELASSNPEEPGEQAGGLPDSGVHGLGHKDDGVAPADESQVDSSDGADAVRGATSLLDVLAEFANPELLASAGGVTGCNDDTPISNWGIGTLDFLAAITRYENETGHSVDPRIVQANITVGAMRACASEFE